LTGVAKLRPFHLIRISVDGHYKGGPPLKPWVARILGTDPKWGLHRVFLPSRNDWADASISWRGRTNGVVATWFLRENALYEVYGGPGKRNFVWVEDSRIRDVPPVEVLYLADGGGEATVVEMEEEDHRDPPWVRDSATGSVNGWALVGKTRIYRLREGHLYKVHRHGVTVDVHVTDGVARVI